MGQLPKKKSSALRFFFLFFGLLIIVVKIQNALARFVFIIVVQ